MSEIDYEKLAYEMFYRWRVGILPTGQIRIYRLGDSVKAKITQEEIDGVYATLTKGKEIAGCTRETLKGFLREAGENE